MVPKSDKHVRFAAVGDLHCHQGFRGQPARILFARPAEAADALLLCGDLTDYGTAEEAQVLADELAAVSRPDGRRAGQPRLRVRHAGRGRPTSSPDAGVRVLDGEACEIDGVGIAGAKGFAGGFGRGSLGRLGRARDQAVRAGGAARGAEAGVGAGQAAHAAPHRAAALLADRRHRAGRAARRSFPSSAAAGWRSPLLRYPVDAVFHGHAHRGTPGRRTVNGVPVYNVAKPLLQRSYPGQPPFRVLEVPAEDLLPV